VAVPAAGATRRSIHPIALAMARRSSRGPSSRGTVVITTNSSEKPPQGDSVTVCHAYGCKAQTAFTFTPSDISMRMSQNEPPVVPQNGERRSDETGEQRLQRTRTQRHLAKRHLAIPPTPTRPVARKQDRPCLLRIG
jgi:hypothetical protein